MSDEHPMARWRRRSAKIYAAKDEFYMRISEGQHEPSDYVVIHNDEQSYAICRVELGADDSAASLEAMDPETLTEWLHRRSDSEFGRPNSLGHILFTLWLLDHGAECWRI